MCTYSEQAMTKVDANFKIDELKARLQTAEKDLAALPGFIAHLKERIEEISTVEFYHMLVFDRGFVGNPYEILIFMAPRDVDGSQGSNHLKANYPIIRDFYYHNDERDAALCCCSELITKYSLPRDRILLTSIYDEDYKTWLESTFDEIYTGKSYRSRKEKRGYPHPNRGKEKQGVYIDEPSGAIEIEHGSIDGVLSDGRPYRAEFWSESEFKYVTFIFSTEDVESYDDQELTVLLEPQLKLYRILKTKPGTRVIRDKSENRMWSVTYQLD